MGGVPAVIALEHIGDGDHHVERFGVVAAAAQGLAVQGLTELQQFELRQPVALLTGRQLRRLASPR